jgi:SAM-dependent methyltransferase
LVVSIWRIESKKKENSLFATTPSSELGSIIPRALYNLTYIYFIIDLLSRVVSKLSTESNRRKMQRHIMGASSLLAVSIILSLVLLEGSLSQAFTTVSPFVKSPSRSLDNESVPSSSTMLKMGLDMVTYMRCEWVSAALCTNQTPRSADVCLVLGCEDGRPVTFLPRTIEKLITSTVEPDGILPVNVRRQLKQQEKVRGVAIVDLVDQRADDLKEVDDESVDVVLSLQTAAKMKENGLDWKKGVQEAARVLKPGGRFLCVEQKELDGQSYMEYVGNLGTVIVRENDEDDGDNENLSESYPTFECMGYDDVDLVLVPHIATVFIKSEDAGMTEAERLQKESQEQEDRIAEISIDVFEKGLKKRRRKKKKKTEEEEVE